MATRPRKTALPDSSADTPITHDVAQFEASLKELEAVVVRMEQGEQTLEDSLRDFERGVQLTRLCQNMMSNAQQRVEILTREGQMETFSADDANNHAG